MARIRTIKPQHVNDKELAKLPLSAHLFWVLSWCFSDDEGVMENDPLLLKSQIFPRRTDIRIEQVEQWIDQLVKARFMIPFTHNGQGYLLHRTFKTHQRIDKPQESKIPDAVILGILSECSKNDPACIGEEGNSKGKERKPAAPSTNLIEYPFTTLFKTHWQDWKDYKKTEHRFSYKSQKSEQASLSDLVKKSAGIEEVAIAMLQQSIANGWKGFYEMKNKQNGQSNHQTGKQGTSVDRTEALKKW